MYTKYHTQGIVLGHRDSGEADRAMSIFTKDFGKIWARVQSVREERSRHRSALQTFSLVDISLVSARHGWRITNTTPILSWHALFRDNIQARGVVTRVVTLLKRLLHGEEHSHVLFSIVTNGFTHLAEVSTKPDTLRYVEVLIVLRVLNNLGYIKHAEEFKSIFFLPEQFDEETINLIKTIYPRVIQEINYALEASQL